MTSQPLVSVFNMDDNLKVLDKKVVLPGVFTAAIRNDIVQFVHSNLAKNKR
jgi:large subunit ribosomal protein L4e